MSAADGNRIEYLLEYHDFQDDLIFAAIEGKGHLAHIELHVHM